MCRTSPPARSHVATSREIHRVHRLPCRIGLGKVPSAMRRRIVDSDRPVTATTVFCFRCASGTSSTSSGCEGRFERAVVIIKFPVMLDHSYVDPNGKAKAQRSCSHSCRLETASTSRSPRLWRDLSLLAWQRGSVVSASELSSSLGNYATLSDRICTPPQASQPRTRPKNRTLTMHVQRLGGVWQDFFVPCGSRGTQRGTSNGKAVLC
jgi:hypothetical protein